MNVKYRQKFNVGKVMTDNSPTKEGDTYTDVTCFPLFGVLKAMNVSRVDYFSLDVEGNEMDVLRTIPFDEIDITVRVEWSFVGQEVSSIFFLWLLRLGKCGKPKNLSECLRVC